MRILLFIALVIIGFIAWKMVKLARTMRNEREKEDRPTVEFPPDRAYRNIEDAEFEDLGKDPDKPA